MKKLFKTFFAPMLAASIMAGSVFFVAPATAHAGASSCLIGLLKSKVTGTSQITTAAVTGTGRVTAATVTGGVAGAMSVPVYDSSVMEMVKASNAAVADLVKANAIINSNTDAQTNGLSIQRCIVEPLVTTLARTLLNKFTAQTVNWINSGFKGSPLYVTNLQGFMMDVTDQTIGTFIEGLGPIGQFLCSPFDLQLRLSLNIEYGMSGYQEEIGCRLTDIQNNVNRAFTSGVFGKNGWDNWLQITATPQNNPYGAYIKAVDALDARIAGAQTIQLTQLGWGSGFLSSVNPETGEVETPGKIIETQLSETLAQPIKNIGLAKDLDAILNALVGQMINQVLGPGGLLGAGTKGSSSSSGGQSAVDRGLNTTASDTLNQNETSQTLPDGVLPAGQTPTKFCFDFQHSLYFRNTADNPNTIYFQLGTVGTDGKTTYSSTKQEAFKQSANSIASVPWTVTDYNNVVNFCNNVDYTVPIDDKAGRFIEEQIGTGTGTATTTTTIQETPQNRLISTAGVIANQSYAQPDGYGLRTAQNALTGRWASTYPLANSWMTFTFPSNQTFGAIQISGYPSLSGHLNGATVTISNGAADPSPFKHTITVAEATDINGSLNTGSTISIAVPSKNGNIVKIDNQEDYIFITGIKFLSPDISAPALGGLPIAFSPSTIPLTGSVITTVPGVVNTQSITVASGQTPFGATIVFNLSKLDNGVYKQIADVSAFFTGDGAKFKFCPDQGTLDCGNSNNFTAIPITSSASFSHDIPVIPQSNNSKIRYQFTIRGTVARGDYKITATMLTYTGTLMEIYITVQ